jgi:hypothetical protein
MTRKQLGNGLAILAGVVYLVVLSVAHVRGAATDSWPAAEGQVISMELRKRWFGGGSKHSRERNRQVADIHYRYSVNGITYTSRTHHIAAHGVGVSLSGSRSYLRDVLRVEARYTRGAPVTVYYQPGNPECAVLRKGSSVGLPMFLVGFAAICLGGFHLKRG